ncbi:putative membrane protein [Lysobacter antibioticus]|uniref:DUF4153 domain-containing protein n=1 Tax=Lysobacter antibioticus TaxID=84531 RepID=UPI0007174F09|nr:DUF4153 domain-containing protein [Lysobacter antibioticus]ALN61612.1 putative membrane protein [Lysobacter antibioticus]
MSTAPALPRSTRGFIVAVALLQGLLLYLARSGHVLDGHSTQIGWYALVLSVPSAMILSVQALRDRRFWEQSLGLAAIYAALAAWAGWSATGAPQIKAGAVLWPFAASVAIALFIALPYLQCRIQHRRWSAPYPDLFEYGWQNALTLILTGVFVGISWGVLALCTVLFKLIGIEFFGDLFSDPRFAYLATGTMVGLGILVGRTQQRPVQVARQILFAIFKGLLPLLSLIAVVFVLSLPFTGLDALWRTRSATLILMCLIALLVLFVNAVYQDGEGEPPYPLWLRRIVEAALLSLPVYASLGLYALGLRIVQHGWTGDRFWALVASLLLSGYAFGYAWAALRPRQGWLRPLMRVNVIVSLAALAFAVAANSWLLDPHRLSVGDQFARLRDGRVAAEDFDLKHLRFDSGRRGYEALLALRTDPKFAAAAEKAELERVIALKDPWVYDSEHPDKLPKTLTALRQRIKSAPGADAPDPTWLQVVLDRKLSTPDCLDEHSECLLLTPDLDRDGRNDYLLCSTQKYSARCFVYALEHGTWIKIGDSHVGAEFDAIESALRKGDVRPVPRRWADYQFGEGGEVIRLELERVERVKAAEPAETEKSK